MSIKLSKQLCDAIRAINVEMEQCGQWGRVTNTKYNIHTLEDFFVSQGMTIEDLPMILDYYGSVSMVKVYFTADSDYQEPVQCLDGPTIYQKPFGETITVVIRREDYNGTL